MRPTERTWMKFKWFFTNENTTQIDPLIDAVLDEMHKEGPLTEEYQTLLKNLERLEELKARDRKKPASRDTIWMVCGNIAIAVGLVVYEQKHVLTSRALQ